MDISTFPVDAGWLGIILVALGFFFEVTKIPINPISWIGKLLNKDINKKIDTLETKVDNIECKHDTTRCATLRKNILQFAENCSMDGCDKHTKEHYDNIFNEITEYDEIIERRKLKNGAFTESAKYIKECYHYHMAHSSFAQTGANRDLKTIH